MTPDCFSPLVIGNTSGISFIIPQGYVWKHDILNDGYNISLDNNHIGYICTDLYEEMPSSEKRNIQRSSINNTHFSESYFEQYFDVPADKVSKNYKRN
jgi:hypothetical protein